MRRSPLRENLNQISRYKMASEETDSDTSSSDYEGSARRTAQRTGKES